MEYWILMKLILTKSEFKILNILMYKKRLKFRIKG